jgi:hypothetical protein
MIMTLREHGNLVAAQWKRGHLSFEDALYELTQAGFNQDAARSILYCGRVGQ